MKRSPRKGFTLIELLIVVAIIAILAAIAVPNFLDAMVRCRVARTQSDLRATSVALESYRTDYAQYPRATLFMALPQRLVPITTPIAYLSTLPRDPFYKQGASSNDQIDPEYCYASGNIYFGASNQFDNQRFFGTIFSVTGRGPDGGISAGGYCMAHPIALRNKTGVLGAYDPTNGTISAGDIIRLGGGTLGRDF